MMNFKSIRQSAILAVLAALLTISVLSAATYAWFTFSNDVNITPITGTVSRGEGSLLISASSGGPFDVSCILPFESDGSDLYPLSTADLITFYTPIAQSNGIVTKYADATDTVNSRTLHGRVWLLAETEPCDVYFWTGYLSFGVDAQALATLRLGLRFVTAEGTHTYIFRLDEFGNTQNADAHLTTAQAGVVVAGIDAEGNPNYIADVSALTAPYRATVDEETVIAGETPLCSLGADEVGSVEYWLWLEGCDENCFNAVQARDLALQLGFAGA